MQLSRHIKLLLSLTNLSSVVSKYKIGIKVCTLVNGQSEYETIGETDELLPDDNYSIQFNYAFIITYLFEEQQTIIFSFFKDNSSTKEIKFPISQVVQSRSNTPHPVIIDQNDNQANLHFKIQNNISNNIISKLSLIFLLEKPYQDKSEYLIFFYIETQTNQNENDWTMVYKSNSYELKQNVPLEVKEVEICKDFLLSPHNNEILITICHSSTQERIGLARYEVITIHNHLDKLAETPIVVPNKLDFVVGKIKVRYQEEKLRTFADYVNQGLQMDLIIGIDYTQSNLIQTNPKSLHYLDNDGNQLNDYEKAINTCGNIVSQYDKDQLFPVYGFGAKLKNDNTGKVNHCFPINFNQENPEIVSIKQIALFYRKSMEKIEMNGPTFFAPLITKVCKQIKEEKDNKTNKYYILMILTDGLANDMTEVREIIVKASRWPLSIIIVGIGEGDGNIGSDGFPLMTELEGLVTDEKGKKAIRSLGKFVKFNCCKGKETADLQKRMLSQIPQQVVKYYQITKSWV